METEKKKKNTHRYIDLNKLISSTDIVSVIKNHLKYKRPGPETGEFYQIFKEN